VDGPTEPTDLDQTAQNKVLVAALMSDVLVHGDLDKLPEYISQETFTQHNPRIADGLAGLRAFTDSLAVQGVSMKYEQIHKVVGSGNFVAVLSQVKLGDSDNAVMDLFRVADGLIVEHWDVIEEITPEDTWVNSGKF
jgi:predicted SnoaL-like aldol condensation-catalyzing enzyme